MSDDKTNTVISATQEHIGASGAPANNGVLSFMNCRYSTDVDGVDLAILGVPFDAATSSRPGARFGPQAIRLASRRFDNERQYPFHLNLFENMSVIDYGDCVLDYGNHGQTPARIENIAKHIIDSGAYLLSFGGDHYVTWPLLKAHAAKYGPLALIQFDSHQDTWNDDGQRIDHGTFVTRAVKEGIIDPSRSIQIGIRTHAPSDYGIKIIYGHELETKSIGEIVAEIKNHVGDSKAYLTFDIDCLDPAYAPGTGTPVAGGPSSARALSILRELGSLNICGSDVVEVAPAYDHADITAIAGASIAMYMVGMRAEKLIEK